MRFYQTVYDEHLPELPLEGRNLLERSNLGLQRLGARLGIRTTDLLARRLVQLLQEDMGVETLLLWVRQRLVAIYNIPDEEAQEVARKLHWEAPAEARKELGRYLYGQLVRADVVADAWARSAREAGRTDAEAARGARRIFPGFAWGAPPLSEEAVQRVREEWLMRKVLLRDRGYEPLTREDARKLRAEFEARLSPEPPSRGPRGR